MSDEKRQYRMKRRAEQEAQTRLRITESAVDLHGTLGPARTSLSMVAERAGVQRNTLYAHFPDERSLALACSGLHLEREPPPDAAAWRDLPAGCERLRGGLGRVYGWYARTAEITACVLRDAEHHAVTREVMALRFGPAAAAWRAVLGEGLTAPQQALVHLALGFHTWQALVQEAGLDEAAAAGLMADAVVGAGPG